MRIAVCLKAVSDSRPGASSGRFDGAEDGFFLNEWDAYALEEALRLAERSKGEVAAFSAGGEETGTALRRALALGASSACRVAADGNEPFAVARGLAACLRERGDWDLLIFGAQSQDRGGGQIGGMVAAALERPFVSLAMNLTLEAAGLVAEREIEGRRRERFRLALPCAVSVQTGINAPRYVSVRGIHRASREPVDLFVPPVACGSGVVFTGYSPPEPGKALMLSGSAGEMAETLVDLLRAQRGV